MVEVAAPELCMAPLAVCSPDGGEFECQRNDRASGWVLDMVLSFRLMVGVSCEGYEADLLCLFAAFGT